MIFHSYGTVYQRVTSKTQVPVSDWFRSRTSSISRQPPALNSAALVSQVVLVSDRLLVSSCDLQNKAGGYCPKWLWDVSDILGCWKLLENRILAEAESIFAQLFDQWLTQDASQPSSFIIQPSTIIYIWV